jgi:hypothetical protein
MGAIYFLRSGVAAAIGGATVAALLAPLVALIAAAYRQPGSAPSGPIPGGAVAGIALGAAAAVASLLPVDHPARRPPRVAAVLPIAVAVAATAALCLLAWSLARWVGEAYPGPPALDRLWIGATFGLLCSAPIAAVLTIVLIYQRRLRFWSTAASRGLRTLGLGVLIAALGAAAVPFGHPNLLNDAVGVGLLIAITAAGLTTVIHHFVAGRLHERWTLAGAVALGAVVALPLLRKFDRFDGPLAYKAFVAGIVVGALVVPMAACLGRRLSRPVLHPPEAF